MPVQIEVVLIQKHSDPFRDHPWGVMVTKKQVEKALRSGQLVPQPTDTNHAGRIAYLVENEAQDAIELDVGIPSMGYPGPANMTIDGNHRLAAAIYKNKKTILSSVSGSLNHAKELFGVDCEE